MFCLKCRHTIVIVIKYTNVTTVGLVNCQTPVDYFVNYSKFGSRHHEMPSRMVATTKRSHQARYLACPSYFWVLSGCSVLTLSVYRQSYYHIAVLLVHVLSKANDSVRALRVD